MGKLDEKVAIITGGSVGIGEACVKLFAQEGAYVVIADIKDSQGKELAYELGDKVTFKHTDVSQESDIKGVVDFALEKFNRLDCMIAYSLSRVISSMILYPKLMCYRWATFSTTGTSKRKNS